MISEQLLNVEKWYSSKYGLALPLSAEQVVNAVVEWLGEFGDDYTIKKIETGTPYAGDGTTITPITFTMGDGRQLEFNVTATNGTQGQRGETGAEGRSIVNMATDGYVESTNYTITNVVVNMSDGSVYRFELRARNGSGGGYEITPIIQEGNTCYVDSVTYENDTATIDYTTVNGTFRLDLPLKGSNGITLDVNEDNNGLVAKIDMTGASPDSFLGTDDGDYVKWVSGSTMRLPYIVLMGTSEYVSDAQLNTLLGNLSSFIVYQNDIYRRVDETDEKLTYANIIVGEPELGSYANNFSLKGSIIRINKETKRYTVKESEVWNAIYRITPATSQATTGSITQQLYNAAKSSYNISIVIGNEYYYRSDNENGSGYVVFTHVGRDTTNEFFIKSLTLQESTLTWTLNVKEFAKPLYLHIINANDVTSLHGRRAYLKIINRSSTPFTVESFRQYLQSLGTPYPCGGYVESNFLYRITYDGSRYTWYYAKASSTSNSSLSDLSDVVVAL